MFETITDIEMRMQERTKDFFHEFRGFVFKQNVLSLAIGVIIGGATNQVVQAINADVLMPVVNLFFKDQAWKTYGPLISHYRDTKGQWVDNRLLVGDLIWNLANLMVIGFVAYLLTKLVLRPLPAAAAPPQPPSRQCPFCLENVPLAARKCKFCTSDLPPVPLPEAAGAAPA